MCVRGVASSEEVDVTWLHYIGSGFTLFLLLYVVIDLFEKEKLTVSDVTGRVVLVLLLFTVLLRT